MVIEYLDDLLNFNKYSLFYQSLVSFTAGLVLAPFSGGFLIFIVYLIIYEIIFIMYALCKGNEFIIMTRFIVITLSLIGFIIGRKIIGKPVLAKYYTSVLETDRVKNKMCKLH